MTHEELERQVKDLSQRVVTLEKQNTLLSVRVKRSTLKQRRADERQNQEINYLKKVLFFMIAGVAAWSIVGVRIREVRLSDENVSVIIQIIGYVVTGGVGYAAMNQNKTHQNKLDEEDDEAPC